MQERALFIIYVHRQHGLVAALGTVTQELLQGMDCSSIPGAQHSAGLTVLSGLVSVV